MAYDIDPDQAVSIVAIFLFIDAAFVGFPLLSALVNGNGLLLIPLLLAAGLIAAGVGLLQGRRWGWYLALVVVGVSALLALGGGLIAAGVGLLIDALIIFLLTRPATRAKFGVR
jgi:hypothetical protein